MEEIVDLIVTNSSSSQISDKLKELMFTKASQRIEVARPQVAVTMFGNQESESGE